MICKFKYELGQSNNFKYVAAIFKISRFSDLHYNFLLVISFGIELRWK